MVVEPKEKTAISGAIVDILAHWPEAQAAVRKVLSDSAKTISMARLTVSERRNMEELTPDEQLTELAALSQIRDPLAVLASIPYGIAPFDNPAMEGISAPSPLREFAPTAITLIAKLTRYCNLRCTYCTDWREGPGNNMPVAVQRRMLEAAMNSGHFGACKVVWHGGEPSQFGVRRSLQFLWLQGRLRRSGLVIQNSLQTNAAFLTDEIVDLWKAFGMKVSVSLDGTSKTHNATRKMINGEGSFEHVISGVRKLKEAGVFQGVLMVVTPDLATIEPRVIISELVANGIHSAAFLPVRPSAKDGKGPYLRPQQFAQFLIGIFDTLRLSPELDFNLREIDALFNAYRKQPTGFCELNGPCVGYYFAIDPDGTIMHCDKFLNAQDYKLGNVATDCLFGLSQSPKIKALQARDVEVRNRLKTCRWFKSCKGWCPHEAHIATLRQEDQACCGMSAVFDHFASLEAAAYA